MAAKSDALLGRLPGQSKWLPFHVEATATELHIYERDGNTKGRQMRTLQLGPGDMVGEERCKRKKRHKFYVQRADGRYIFKCLTDDPEDREQWIMNLQIAINNQSRFDEGGSASLPASSMRRNHVATPQGQSMPKQAYLEKYVWFWGHISRQACEQRLRTEGCQGSFVVRINADGDYVMSIWRPDAIHHYKIGYINSMFCFQRSVVQAEGPTLLELLESYMSASTDKIIMPIGGWLYALKDEGTSMRPARYRLATESPIVDSRRAPATDLHNPSPATSRQNFYTPTVPDDATKVQSLTFGQTTQMKSLSETRSLPEKQMFRTPPVTRRPLVPPDLHPPVPKSSSLQQLSHFDTCSLPEKRKFKTPPVARKPQDPEKRKFRTPPVARRPLVPPDLHPPVLKSSSLEQLSTVRREGELSHMQYINWSTIAKSRHARDAMNKQTMEQQTPYYMNTTHNSVFNTTS